MRELATHRRRFAALLVVAAAAVVGCVRGDFVVTNETGADLTNVELLRYGIVRGRIERLAPGETVRVPFSDHPEEGWAVGWTDAEGSWIAPGCIYPEFDRDEAVVIRAGHLVNSDSAKPVK